MCAHRALPSLLPSVLWRRSYSLIFPFYNSLTTQGILGGSVVSIPPKMAKEINVLLLLGVIAPAAMFVTKVMRMDSRDRHVLDMRLKHHSSFWVKGNRLVEGVSQIVLSSVTLDHNHQQIEVVAAMPPSFNQPAAAFVSSEKHPDPYSCDCIVDNSNKKKGLLSWGSTDTSKEEVKGDSELSDSENEKLRKERIAMSEYVLAHFGEGMTPSTNPTTWTRRNVVPAALWFIDPKQTEKQRTAALDKLVKARAEAEKKRADAIERQSLFPS